MVITTVQAPSAGLLPLKAVSSPPTAVNRCLSGRSTNGQHHRAGRILFAARVGSGGRKRNVHVTAAMPVSDVALVIPSLTPVLFRAFSAGLLLYSTLAWASARSDRKQVCTDGCLPSTLQAIACLTAIVFEISAKFPQSFPKNFVLQVESNIAEQKVRQAAQKAKLDRLRGTTKDSSADSDK